LLPARDTASAVELRLRAEDRGFVLWLDVEPGGGDLRLELLRPDGQLVLAVGGLHVNERAAVTLALDARNLADSEYLLRLYEEGPQGALRQEHRLSIRR
jgi:hypothetical protein